MRAHAYHGITRVGRRFVTPLEARRGHGGRGVCTASGAIAAAKSGAACGGGGDAYVKVVEVGARDGLQNEKAIIATDVKIDLITRLTRAGLKSIEATSFVSPKWVPQMADHKEVMEGISGLIKAGDATYSVLTPNMKGYMAAARAGATEVAVFVGASETFSRNNINAGVEESLVKCKEVVDAARDANIAVRGYVSCVVGCPYEGHQDPKRVAVVAKRLWDMGCYEISLGDTIGVGTEESTKTMLEHVLGGGVPVDAIAVHYHNTSQTALRNINVALNMGIRAVDSSVGELGGCPYAKGATGNVATEDVLRLLHDAGMKTRVDLDAVLDTGRFIKERIAAARRQD